jgi:hypothetical protein
MRNCKLLLMTALLLVGFSVSADDGVTRSAFTSAIEDKEPVDQIKELTTDSTKIYFFTEITGMNDLTMIHRWEYNEKVMAEVSFDVRANRWRVWSSKNLNPSWTGEWKVSVVDEGGNILSTESFVYKESAKVMSEEADKEPAKENKEIE